MIYTLTHGQRYSWLEETGVRSQSCVSFHPYTHPSRESHEGSRSGDEVNLFIQVPEGLLTGWKSRPSDPDRGPGGVGGQVTQRQLEATRGRQEPQEAVRSGFLGQE